MCCNMYAEVVTLLVKVQTLMRPSNGGCRTARQYNIKFVNRNETLKTFCINETNNNYKVVTMRVTICLTE